MPPAGSPQVVAILTAAFLPCDKPQPALAEVKLHQISGICCYINLVLCGVAALEPTTCVPHQLQWISAAQTLGRDCRVCPMRMMYCSTPAVHVPGCWCKPLWQRRVALHLGKAGDCAAEPNLPHAMPYTALSKTYFAAACEDCGCARAWSCSSCLTHAAANHSSMGHVRASTHHPQMPMPDADLPQTCLSHITLCMCRSWQCLDPALLRWPHTCSGQRSALWWTSMHSTAAPAAEPCIAHLWSSQHTCTTRA